MADVQSLADLKKENEALEKAAADQEAATQKAAEEKEKAEAEADDPPPPTPEKKEADDTVAGADADWAKPDEEQPPAKFTDSDVAQVRRKYKGKLRETESELEKLRKENEELRKKPAAPAAAVGEKPQPDSYASDAEYHAALAEWTVDNRLATQRQAEAAEQQRRAREEAQQETEQAVETHYERAAKLAETASITPDAFKEADYRVRAAIDSVFDKAGDTITDNLIARLGAGSEKVMYNLGVNKARREELVALLRKDRTGLSAMAWLAELKAQLVAPAKRETKTPDPAPDVKGDKQGGAGQGNKLKREYDAAHKAGDGQKALNIKRQARGIGVDTSGW